MIRNAGICDAVERCLKQDGDMRYDQLCFAMRDLYSRGNISGALSTLVRGRSIHKYGDERNATYGVRARPQESSTGVKKYVPTFVPLKSKLFDAWANCTRAPFDPSIDEKRLIR